MALPPLNAPAICRRISKALLLIGAASVPFLGGCDLSGVEQRRQLAWINVDKAVGDADQAVRRGDHRLYGVYGYSIEMHGAPESAAWEQNRCGLKMIEGTSDANYSEDAYERPREYAKRYNERIIARTGCLTQE